MITRNTVSLVEVLQLKNPENLRSLGPLLFRVLPPQCQILKPLVPGHRGAGWGQGWALLPSGTLSISEGSWCLLVFTGSAGETGVPPGHEPVSGGQLASFAPRVAGLPPSSGWAWLSPCQPRTRLPT